jgi:hypothetical protein
VRLLLHLQSNFADSSQYGIVPTWPGAERPAFAAPARYGQASPLFYGGLAPSYQLPALSSQYSFDFYARVSQYGNGLTFLLGYSTFRLCVVDYGPGSNDTDWSMSLRFEDLSTGNLWQSSPNVFPFGAWNHVALQFKSGAGTLYANGSPVLYLPAPSVSGTPALTVGGSFITANPPGVRIQEFRMLSVAPYQGAFVPPTAPY